MGSQMSRCGDLQCSLSEQSKVPVEGISRRAHRVSNSSRKSRTTSWPTATRLYTALHCCTVYVMQFSSQVQSRATMQQYSAVTQFVLWFVVGSQARQRIAFSLSRFRKYFGYRLYRLYMLFFRLSLSVYQIIIMKNVYRIFQFEVTRSLFSYVSTFIKISKPFANSFRLKSYPAQFKFLLKFGFNLVN